MKNAFSFFLLMMIICTVSSTSYGQKSKAAKKIYNWFSQVPLSKIDEIPTAGAKAIFDYKPKYKRVSEPIIGKRIPARVIKDLVDDSFKRSITFRVRNSKGAIIENIDAYSPRQKSLIIDAGNNDLAKMRRVADHDSKILLKNGISDRLKLVNGKREYDKLPEIIQDEIKTNSKLLLRKNSGKYNLVNEIKGSKFELQIEFDFYQFIMDLIALGLDGLGNSEE